MDARTENLSPYDVDRDVWRVFEIMAFELVPRMNGYDNCRCTAVLQRVNVLSHIMCFFFFFDNKVNTEQWMTFLASLTLQPLRLLTRRSFGL